MNNEKGWNARLKHYGADSTRRSGVRKFPCTLWPSIKINVNVKSVALMQVNASFLELPVPNTPDELREVYRPVHSSPSGEISQSLVKRPVTIRRPITMDPSGLTIVR